VLCSVSPCIPGGADARLHLWGHPAPPRHLRQH
jgi:hypothetical protein